MASISPFPFPRSRDIHIIVIIPSGLSFLVTVIGSYWFFALHHSQRNFRRTLILILILADCSKSFWIMLFQAVALANNNGIVTSSTFCQAGGFFLQFSFEACDVAIAFLITHVSWQIIPPSCFPRGKDGLWHVRRFVLAACIIVPAINAAIPFHRLPDKPAYIYDGVYCSLVSGPLWMSLLLSWVPRYLLWLYMLGTLLRLFLYIRSQSFPRSLSVHDDSAHSPWHTNGRADSVAPDGPRSNNKGSLWSKPAQRHAKQRPRHGSMASKKSLSSDVQRPQRQLRSVSLYPLFYIMAWAVPFSTQCVSFSTSKGVNVVYPLRAAAVTCISCLGVVDVTIFSFKEKPWRHGWRFWSRAASLRRSSVESANLQPAPEDHENGTAILQVPESARRPHGGGSDQNRQQVLQAYQRLALEQAETMARPRVKRATPSHDVAVYPAMAEISPNDETS